ncbi:MAG: L-lactate permease [Peptococcaceae bacterium]|nr:L-lactate permease [Peptococcaceae bacterium]
MFLEFILALLPIIWLFIAFLVLKLPGHIGCASALVISIIESIIFKSINFGDTLKGLTVSESLTASVEGLIGAIWPIGFIIIAAMFTYNLCVETKAMELIKNMLTSVTNDKRVLVLILAWGFGGFMEGVAGFGTAVAIPAAMMVALGFNPLFSAVACLIANATPPTFGSIGIPTTTAAGLAGMDALQISGPAMNMLVIPSLLSPFLIIALMGSTEKSKNAFKDMVGFTLIAGVSYVVPALLVAHFVGAETVDLIGNTFSLIVMVLLAAKRKPTEDPDFIMTMSADEKEHLKSIPFGNLAAWSPYVIMLILLIGTSKLVAPINAWVNSYKLVFSVYSGEGAAELSLVILNSAVMLLLAGIIGGFIQKASVGTMCKVMGQTLKGMWKAIATIIFIIAMAKVMGYSGMTSAIAVLLAELTGSFYPALAPLVGILGTFVTGSTTSAGVLFAQMQVQVAGLLGADPVQLVAANMAGGAIGKLISPQSIAIAVAAIGTIEGVKSTDSLIMSKSVKYCVLYGAIVCAFSYVAAVML